MQLLGYAAYAALWFFAVTWTVGVRVKLDAGVGVIIGSMVFLCGAILLPLLEVDFLHSTWLIALGFAASLVVPMLHTAIPPLFSVARLVASVYANLLRLGR